MGSRGEECRNLPQAGSCTTSGGCGQISRCSAEGQPKEHLLNSERLPRQSWRETYNGDSNKSSQCGGFGSRGTGLYPGKEGGTTSSSSRRSSRIHKPGVKFVEPKDTILKNPVESKDMIIENPVESEDMIIENPVESEDMIIENLVLLEDEASIEEKARCLFQAQDFSMDAMENLTSLLVPAIKPSTRSFSRLKGKDSIMLHLGMFSHGNMEGVMKKTWRFPWLTRYANMWMRRQPGMGEASWTSIATSVNVEARPHRDLRNFRRQPQLPGDLRESTTWRRKGPGGQHMTGHVRTTWHQIQAFDPKSWHATMRWTGRRVALAAYTTRLIERAQPFVVKDLKEFEFPVPPKGRGIAGLFCAPDEIEGEYKVMAAEEKEEIMATLEDYEALINESGEDSPEMMNRVVELGSPGESMLKEHLEKAGVEVTSVSFKEGCDLTTLAGTERTVQMLDVVRPHWLVCYLPRGPRYEPDDPRGEHARLKLRKVARNFLKASREALDKGSHVLWTHPESQKLEAFPEVRAFWKSHQDHHGGQAVRCGAMWMRCSSSTLAEAVPHSASSSFLPWKALAEKLVESRMYFAEVMVTETEKQILESMDQKELQEMMDRAHKIHCRLGHPSNRLLIRNLKVRGADPKLVAAASQLTCDQCQDGKRKARRPMVHMEKAERLWETLQLDLCHHRIGSQIHHFLLMQDEASGYAVIRRIKVTSEHEGWNATSADIKHLVQEAWLQYFGAPSVIKLDAEGALRGNLMTDLADEHGVEVQVCPAEHHEFISEVERAIGVLKEKIEAFLRGNPVDAGQAALAMAMPGYTGSVRCNGPWEEISPQREVWPAIPAN